MFGEELTNLRSAVASGTALEIDDALLPLLAHSDPRIIEPILLLLNESSDQDGMWSIVHSAESFSCPDYIKSFLSAVPELKQTCFWWTEILLIRILNSEECRADLIEQLRNAPAATKDCVSAICEKIREDERFYDKTASVLAVAKA